MGKSLLFIALLLLGLNIAKGQINNTYWQIESQDKFNDPSMPLSDGLTMWFTRQNLTIDATWLSIKTEIPSDAENYRLHSELFMPVFKKGKFCSAIGGTYNKSYLLTSDSDIDKDYQYQWLFAVAQYTHNRWRYISSIEYNINGNRNSFFTKQGNRLMPLFTAGYAINKKWEIFLMGGYSLIYTENDKTEEPLTAAQARYYHSPKFKIVFGVPIVFACEWSVTKQLDFFCRYMIYNEAQAYIRYMFNTNFGFSIDYNNTRNKTYEGYFNSENVSIGNTDYEYNKTEQLQHPICLSLILKTYDNTAIQLYAGYNFADNIVLHCSDDEITSIDGKSELYFGFHINYMVFR